MTVQGSGAAPAKRRAIDYSKKYWWIGAIAVPLVAVLIAKIPFGSDAPVPGTSYVTNINIIENEYKEITGQELADPDLRQKIQRAIELGRKHYFNEAAKLFQEIAEKAPLPSIYNNLGVVLQGSGDSVKAQESYKKALAVNPQDKSASANLQAVQVAATQPVHVSATSQEIEPNNDPYHANAIPLNTPISAEITDSSDQDFYVFTIPPTYRDWIQVEIKNASNLKPSLEVLNSDKSYKGGASNGSQAGDVQYSFVAEPSSTYYVHVSSESYDSSGAYILTVRPMKAYDKYEPNDDFQHASKVKSGEVIEANIMDPSDIDFYEFQSSKSGNITVALVNRTGTLRPEIRALNHDRSDLGGNSNNNPSGNVSFSFPAEAGTTYYVKVSSVSFSQGDSKGEYSLTITQQ